MRVLAIVMAAALVILCGACGDRAVGDSPCGQVCLEVRDKLINNFGVPPDQVDCLDGAWSTPQTCEDCKQYIKNRYSVQTEGNDICRHF